MRAVRFLILAAVIGALSGCASQAPKPPAPESWSMTRVSFDALPGWDGAALEAALQSFRRSCAVRRTRRAAESETSYIINILNVNK